MNAPKETRPFDLEHAKGGAPYSCKNGAPATILKSDRRDQKFPLLGFFGGDDSVATWTADGSFGSRETSDFDLVMTPLGYIDGKPVFTGDEIELKYMAKPNEWKRVKVEPSWAGTWTDECARWPAPEKKYPVTGMTDSEIEVLWSNSCQQGSEYTQVRRNFINEALRRAVESGTVVTMDYHCAEQGRIYLKGLDDAKESRAARDMAIAEAVLEACRDCVGSSSMSAIGMGCIDLAAIISKVQQ